jgi:formylglycine-generating enzyme required for sulfatase activity
LYRFLIMKPHPLMTQRALKLFINYRRADERERFFIQHLRTHFQFRYGEENVFMDFENIPAFAEFEAFIRQKVRETDILAMMIGPLWMELLHKKTAAGERDYVLIELEEALAHDKVIAPITILDAPVPDWNALPEHLHVIGKRNVFPIREGLNFRDNVQRIMQGFEDELERQGAARSVANPVSQQTLTAAQDAGGRLNLQEVLKRFAEAQGVGDLPQALLWLAELRASGQAIPANFKLAERERALQERLREQEERRRRREVADFQFEFIRTMILLNDPPADIQSAVLDAWQVEDGYIPDDLSKTLAPLMRALSLPAAVMMPPISPDQQSLLDRMVDERLKPAERAAAGRELAALGDPRPGVGLRPDGLPDIDWRPIEGGPFTMGSDKSADPRAYDDEMPQHTEEVPAFHIARYPVTYAQYEPFVQGGGYQERSYWTKAGWQWRADKTEPEYGWNDPEWHLPNHPVIGVTWYEAYAYSRWLAALLGQDIRLPTEAQWEKAARGTDKRIYPYTGKFDAAKGNTEPSGIGRTSVVGLFPAGASPHDVLDMSGNVWQWCLTKWRSNYKTKADENPEGTDSRVGRGGSWLNDIQVTRAAYRNGRVPTGRNNLQGFRLCALS